MKLKIENLKRLIKEVNKLSKQEPKWVHNLLDKLANKGLNVVNYFYHETMFDFRERYNEDFGDIKVELKWHSPTKVDIIASGEKLLFLEFGSGIYYNQFSVEIHPLASKLGHEIGKYPYAKHNPSWGNREGWVYKKPDGTKQFTRGIFASKGMYYASLDIREKLKETFREVIISD